MSPRAIDTATISFGLVSIPVKIYSAATHAERLSSHLVHARCGTRLKQQLVCPKDHEVVPRSEAVRGFEVAKGELVTITDEELRSTDEKSDAIEIAEFVPLTSIDPTSFENAMYLMPDGKGRAARRAYGLLVAAMRHADLVAIGEVATRGRESLVMLRPGDAILVMHRLRRPEALVRERTILGEADAPMKPAATELTLAGEMIARLTKKTFDPSRYADGHEARLRELLARRKAAHGSIADSGAAPAATTAKAVDLLAALRASLSAPSAVPARRGKRATRPATRARTRTARPHRK